MMGLVTSRRKSNVSLNGCARRRRRTAGALTALSTDYTDLRSGREPSSMAAAMESTGEARSATAIESDLPPIEGVARMRVGTGAAYLLAGLCVGSLAFTSGATANAAGLASATNGSISGTVVDAAGQPVERVCVTASTPPHNGGEACTGANGRYTIAGLAPGEYGVEFIPYATDIYLVSQVWPHHQGLSAKGASVLVRAGHDHHGIDASLSDGGRALVVVSTSTGQGVSDETVCPVLATHNAVDGNCGGTDLTGRGTTGAAPDGSEKVEAIGGGGVVFAPGTHSYRLAATINFVVDQTVAVDITIPKSS